MKNSILSLEGVEVLSKNQQKNVYGGLFAPVDDGGDFGTCCAQTQNGVPYCGLSKARAIQVAAHNNGRYCCDGCATASWM